MVEHFFHREGVGGSIPPIGTNYLVGVIGAYLFYIQMAVEHNHHEVQKNFIKNLVVKKLIRNFVQ